MIERKFIAQNKKQYEIKEFISSELGKIGLSDVRLQNTPLGEKIIVSTSRPGLVVGRSGSNITKLTALLKKKFSLQNPQIEIEEIKDVNSVAQIVAEMIASTLEHYGSQRFKAIGHKYMTDVMRAGALGIEILLSGRIPSARAKTWRFYNGYLKKCGDVAITGVDTAYAVAKLKTGVVGIQVRIMPATTRLPDNIEFKKEETFVEEITAEKAGDDKKTAEKKELKKRKAEPRKKTVKKKAKQASPEQKEETGGQ
ncbi:MAG: 30S ribosomal protein S3 [Candidatus Woesearchaeota archaeon]